jgi:hypothetical protein
VWTDRESRPIDLGLDSRSVHTQDYSSAIDLGLDSRSVHTQDYSSAIDLGLDSYSFMLCAPIFVLTPLCCVLSAKASNTNSKVIELMRPTIQLTIYHRTRSIEIFNVTCFDYSSAIDLGLDSRSVHTQDYSSAIDLGLDSRSVHTQEYKIGICYFLQSK